MTWEENQYLVHYGVKGQKHGVRRYQNEDGSLTAEGKQRYASMYDYGADKSKGLIRRQAEKSHGMTRAFGEWREGRHEKNIDKIKNKYAKKIQKTNDKIADSKKNAKEYYEGDKEWQNASEEGLKEHRKRLEAKRDKKLAKYTSKRDAQSAANANLKAYRDHSSTAKMLMRSAAYEHARARGTSRGKAIMETLDPTGLTRLRRDKKAYGKYIVYGEKEKNSYNGLAMDPD